MPVTFSAEWTGAVLVIEDDRQDERAAAACWWSGSMSALPALAPGDQMAHGGHALHVTDAVCRVRRAALLRGTGRSREPPSDATAAPTGSDVATTR